MHCCGVDVMHPLKAKHVDLLMRFGADWQIAHAQTGKPVSSGTYRHEQARHHTSKIDDTVVGIAHSV